jgi:8-oxo-dGTP diphosphatase
MSEGREKIKACVGVMILKDGKVLLGKRKGKHGSGEYSCPGGHLEFGDSFKDCVMNEAFEEAGVKIKNIKFQCVSNIFRHEGRQDILICFTADWESEEPRDLPEERIGEWQWCDVNNPPQPLFYPSEVLIDSYKTGKNYYDKE